MFRIHGLLIALVLVSQMSRAEDQPESPPFDWELAYKFDLLTNSGGLKSGSSYLGNLDAKVQLDAEKLIEVPGLTAFIYGLGNHGGKPSERIGDLQVTSNIEAPSTFKLYEAWLEQSLVDSKLKARLGLYDLNSEFYATESSGVFLNSSFGIGKEFSQTGLTGPSIFPTTSLGGRVWVQPAPHIYLQAVVLDGVPGLPDHPYGTHVSFEEGDGALLVSEFGYEEDASKYALGLWTYTSRFEALSETDETGALKQLRNQGVYALLDHQLMEGFSIFTRLGLTSSHVNPVVGSWTAGVHWKGALLDRTEDVLGLGLAQAFTSKDFRDSQVAEGASIGKAETTLELTYQAALDPHFSLQPDLQYVIRPGADKNIKNALVATLRGELSF